MFLHSSRSGSPGHAGSMRGSEAGQAHVGCRRAAGTQPWREALPQQGLSPRGLPSPGLQPEAPSSGFTSAASKNSDGFYRSAFPLSPFLPSLCGDTPKNTRSNVKPARGGLVLPAPSGERLRGGGSDQAPPGRVFPLRAEETPQVPPGGGGGRRGEAADKEQRHLHSPSVATLAGLQREVDPGAAGEGQQHLGDVELGGGGEVQGKEEEEEERQRLRRRGSHGPLRATAANRRRWGRERAAARRGRRDVSGGAGQGRAGAPRGGDGRAPRRQGSPQSRPPSLGWVGCRGGRGWSRVK